MPALINNSLFRSNNFCEIPICDKKNNKLNQSQRLISVDMDQKLTCGCFAFEYRSHRTDCKFYTPPNIIGNFGSNYSFDDQPYYPGCLS